MISEHVDKMLGKPWQPGGRGPGGYYCLGVFLDLLERERGIRLEDPFWAIQAPALSAMREFWRHFIQLPTMGDLEPLDVLWRRAAGATHVSIVESPKWAVTAQKGAGVVRVPLREEVRRAERAYRMRELIG